MNKSKISIIVAMSENHIIGDKNGMPWHIPGELPRFKRITTGHPIIMGRKTFESIGKPLPNRLNIVITRDQDWKVDGVTVVHSLDEALEEAKKYMSLNQESGVMNQNEIFIIGGGEIFKQAMGMADKLYLTLIHKTIEGDTYFPEYEDIFTKEVFREDHDEGEYQYSFLELEK